LRRIGDQERRIVEGKLINEQLQVVRTAQTEEVDKAINFATQRLVDKIETGFIAAADAEKASPLIGNGDLWLDHFTLYLWIILLIALHPPWA